jgi:hypothetical protein
MVQINHADHGREKTLSWQALHTYSLDWHRKQGVDFSALNAKLSRRISPA